MALVAIILSNYLPLFENHAISVYLIQWRKKYALARDNA